MNVTTNRQILLAKRPPGTPEESDFELVEAPMPTPGEGEVLVRSIYLSLDPYMRGRMRDVKSYAPPLPIGGVMEGGMVGEVVESKNPAFKAGDFVEERLGWQEYGVSDGSGLRKLDPAVAPISTANGVLGMPGMTAYFGLLEVGEPKAGDTVLVSAASGAVGALVGQIAKIKGCRAVGIAGSDEKCRYVVEELGFDDAFNYKTAGPDLNAAIVKSCPDGVDVYFDNVGGKILDAVLRHIRLHARVVICGMISEINLTEPELAPRATRALLVNRARMQGLIVFDWVDRYREGIEQMAAWLKSGELKYKEDIVKGLENAPKAFIGLLRGENFGKLLVRVGDDPTR